MWSWASSRTKGKGQATVWGLFVLLVPLAGCTDGPGKGPLDFDDEFTRFDRSIEDLDPSRASQVVELDDGATWTLEATMVRHDPGTGQEIRMFAYNDQIPGPLLRVKQGAEITVEFTNQLPYETTVHWHGLRLGVESDGVPGHPHPAVAPGDSFTYELVFPDEGIFWYHPHVREDMQIALGLAGVILVDGERGDDESWPEEHVLTLGDMRVGVDGDVAPFYKEVATHALLGRFGDHYVINGGAGSEEETAAGERVRLHLVNVASARPLRLTFPGAETVEWIGADGGFLQEPVPVSNLLLAPSERVTVDVVMPDSGNVRVLHGAPGAVPITLGTLHVDLAREPVSDPGAPNTPHERAVEELAPLLTDPEIHSHVTWELDLEMDLELEEGGDPHAHHDHGAPIDWEDDDDPANAASHSKNTRWIIRDTTTGAKNMEMDPEFPLGSLVRITLDSLEDAEHPMQHPIHLHGQRFIVERIGNDPQEPVWKDTVLVPGGTQVDILVEMSNPGTWMVHCHTLEHLESGMMGMFTVSP